MSLAEWRGRLGPGHVVLLLMLAVGLVWLGWWGWGKYQEPRTYPYSIAISGGPDGWPVWVEDQIFWGAFSISGGSVSDRSWDEPPDGGKTAVLGDVPIPDRLTARWFSFREQTFYELDIALPEDLEERVRQWYRDYPRSQHYQHMLLAGYSGDGRARLWWEVWCGGPFCDEDEPLYFPIVREAQAEEADGDPGRYTKRTAELREEGAIPADVEVPE